MMLWILGAVVYFAILIVIFSLMRASSEADRQAERAFAEWQERQGEIKKAER